MRQYPTNYRTWAIATGLLFLPIWLLWAWKICEHIAKHGLRFSIIEDFGTYSVVWLLGSGLMGWIAQAIVVVIRGSPKIRQPDTQATDYDDSPPTELPPP